MSSSKLPGGDKPEDRSVTATDSPATAYPTSSQPHGHILPHPNMHPHPSQKSARPIAPAPIMSGSSGTTTLTTPGNIPNFISPDSFCTALVSKTSESRHSMPGTQGLTSSASHSHAGILNSPLVPFTGASSAALTTAALASNQLASGTLRAQVQPTMPLTTHIPKGTMMMRTTQHTPIPIPTVTGHLMVGRQPVIPTIKTGSPANTRASSPAITIPTTQVPVSSEQLRTTMALSVAGPPCAPIQITLRPSAAGEGKPSVAQIQQKIITQPTKIVASPLITPIINANKPVAFPAQTPTGVVVATTATIASVASTGSTSIPVAKVPPQRQQQQVPVSTVAVSLATSLPASMATSLVGSEVLRNEAVSSTGFHPMSSILMQPSRPLNTTTANTTTITIPSRPSQPEVRQDSQQRSNNIPQLSAFSSLGQESQVWYSTPYPVYSPIVTTQAPPAPLVQPLTVATTMNQNLSTLIFPKGPMESTVPNQGPVLSATLAANLQPQPHAMNLAQPQMRLVAVDTRQPLAVHQITNSASIAPSSVSGDPKPLISITSSPRVGTLLPGPAAEMGSLGLTSLPSTATVASSIYTSSTTAQAQPPSSSAPSSNPTSSPRPSILRKRFSDGTTVIPKRPNFTMTNESHSPRPENTPISNASSPKTPACDNSQSSTDTALSAEGQTNSHLDPRNKHETHDGMENGPSVSSNCNTSAAMHHSSAVEESPRKRPRKQLLHINPELKDHTSSDDDMEVKMVDRRDDQAHRNKLEIKDEYIDEEGIRYVSRSANPKVGLLNFYSQTWKAKNNHFTRYSDVKKKDERRPTVNELANKRGIVQKSSGWKIYCMSAQLEHYMDYEKSYFDKLCDLQTSLTPKQSKHSLDDDSSSLYECTQACIQRSKLLLDQTGETINNMMQILNHKPPITEIIHKHMSKRPIKKKERT